MFAIQGRREFEVGYLVLLLEILLQKHAPVTLAPVYHHRCNFSLEWRDRWNFYFVTCLPCTRGTSQYESMGKSQRNLGLIPVSVVKNMYLTGVLTTKWASNLKTILWNVLHLFIYHTNYNALNLTNSLTSKHWILLEEFHLNLNATCLDNSQNNYGPKCIIFCVIIS